MEKPVLSESFSKLNWISEDLSPLLNSLNILVHVLAIGKVSWELKDDWADLSKTSHELSAEKVLKDSVNVGEEILTSLHASDSYIRMTLRYW